MNGRLYDPYLQRFLSPDNYVQSPFNAQKFNRYAYCLNNPLMYTDPSGEFLDLALFIIGSAILKGIWNATDPSYHGEWNWKAFWVGCWEGGTMAYSMVASGGMCMFNQFLPSINFDIGPIECSIGIGLLFGMDGYGLGAFFSANLPIDLGDGYYVNIGADFGVAGFTSSPGGKGPSAGYRYGYGVQVGHTDFALSMYSSSFKSTAVSCQRVGGIGIHSGYFSLRYENDGAPFKKWFGSLLVNEGSDKLRTNSVSIGWKDFSIGVNLFTGDPSTEGEPWPSTKPGYKDEVYYPNGYCTAKTANDYRLGALYFGYQNYRIGTNSEWVRHYAQNIFAHDWFQRKVFHNSGQPGFLMLDKVWNYYFNYGFNSKYTLW